LYAPPSVNLKGNLNKKSVERGNGGKSSLASRLRYQEKGASREKALDRILTIGSVSSPLVWIITSEDGFEILLNLPQRLKDFPEGPVDFVRVAVISPETFAGFGEFRQ